MLFKNGNRSFYVLSKDMKKSKALSKANEHFKTNTKDLEIQSGKMIDKDTVEIGAQGDVWVVSRRSKR